MRAPHSSAVSATVARVVSADTGTGSLAASASSARPSRTRSSSVVTSGSDRSRGLLERPRAQDPRDLLAVERLTLEQRAGERVELLDVLIEDLAGAGGALHDDALDLGVDEQRGRLAVILRARDLPPQKDVLLVLAEGQRAELVGHPPLADHLARHLGGCLERVAGGRRVLLQDHLRGGPA